MLQALFMYLLKYIPFVLTDSLKCITGQQNVTPNRFIKSQPKTDVSLGFSNSNPTDEKNLKGSSNTPQVFLSTSLPCLFENPLSLNSISKSLPVLYQINNHTVHSENELSVHIKDKNESIFIQPDNSPKNIQLTKSDSNESLNHLNTMELISNLNTSINNNKSHCLPIIEPNKLLNNIPNTSNVDSLLIKELENSIYHIKWIKFNNQTRPIITQNNNGPCPMIAIANVLLLRGTINLSNDSELISGNRLLAILSELLLSKAPNDLDYDQQINYESNFRDVLCLFPSLQTGLDINIRFTGVADFEYTPTLSLFDLFNIHIYHGWLVDPDEHDLAATVGNRTYNQLTEELLRLESSDNYEDLKRSILVEWFLNESGSQLTFHGLSQLVTTLHDEELAVFFRNNHFNTILKHKDSIFVLVTDMGLLNEPNIVWELLNDLDGDTQFVDCSFQLFCPTTSDSSIRKTSDAVRVITIKSDKLDSKSRTDCKSTSNIMIYAKCFKKKKSELQIKIQKHFGNYTNKIFTSDVRVVLGVRLNCYDLCKMLQEEEIRASNQDPETFWKLYK
ncbi:uncharacterized protein DC041_0012393 [Schistosoma bovis]|uniref:Ubiquitin carboxyl-terminal hydrolase n=1 Tax=Schistosoma bovis TaxID=6184 RepID=A0A430QBW3_SCHBO|nr:uncharacterized protein DC041_0012393 [Schistosoma bovis]